VGESRELSIGVYGLSDRIFVVNLWTRGPMNTMEGTTIQKAIRKFIAQRYKKSSGNPALYAVKIKEMREALILAITMAKANFCFMAKLFFS
jgi:hypothetical protein